MKDITINIVGPKDFENEYIKAKERALSRGMPNLNAILEAERYLEENNFKMVMNGKPVVQDWEGVKNIF